ncbi:MAG: hypothetical protein AAF211_32580, partial [Myxococcota bacterium]
RRSAAADADGRHPCTSGRDIRGRSPLARVSQCDRGGAGIRRRLTGGVVVSGLWIVGGLAFAQPSTHVRAQAGPIGVSSAGRYASELSIEIEHWFLGREQRHGLGLRGALAADYELLGDTNGLIVAEPYWVSAFPTGRKTFVALQGGFGLGQLRDVDDPGLFSPSETTSRFGWTVHAAPGFGWHPGALEFSVFGRVRLYETAVMFTPVFGVGGHF